MVDTAMQELRRRAEQDPSARPQLLVARVRAGELHPDRLELAAWVGDRDARTAVDGTPDGRAWPVTLADVVLGLRHFGELEVRAAVAAARLAYPGWVAYQDTCTIAFRVRPGESRERASERAFAERVAPPREVIDLAAAWLADPTLERARALEPYCQENELGEPFGLGTTMPMWAWSLAAGVLRVSGADPLILENHPSYGVLDAARELGKDQVLTAVRDALAGWALGEGARG